MYSRYKLLARSDHLSLTMMELGILVISIPSLTRSSRMLNSSCARSKKCIAFRSSEWSSLKKATSPGLRCMPRTLLGVVTFFPWLPFPSAPAASDVWSPCCCCSGLDASAVESVSADPEAATTGVPSAHPSGCTSDGNSLISFCKSSKEEGVEVGRGDQI